MKPQLAIIGLSCLAVALLAGIAHARRGPVVTPNAASEPVASAVSEAHSAPPAAAAPKPAATPAAKFSWSQIESEDYHQYIANLRAIGCSEQTIRDIIIADVNKLYAARENPLKTKPKPGQDNAVVETPEQALERLRQLRIVQQEKRETIKELLGIDIPLDMLPSSASRNYHAFEVALGYLPPEKRDAVQALQETYWQNVDALKGKVGKGKTPESVAESRQLTASLRQDLAKLLTPQELEDYELRTSPTAKQLSDKLATYFQPSEPEYRQIYRVQRDYEQAIEQLAQPNVADGQNVPRDPKAMNKARTAAQEQMNQELKTALGDARYTEYQRSQDRTYDLLSRLGERYDLPQETVLQAYDLQNSFKQPSGQPADRAAAQKQLNDQLTAILGEQAARGYRRVNGGTVPLK